MSKRSDYRYGNFISLGDAIGKFSKDHQLDGKLRSARVCDQFRNLLPEKSRTQVGKVDFSNGIVRAQISSAPLRKDLQMASASLCDLLNEKMEETLVHKIVLY